MELPIVARRLGALTAYQLPWNAWNKATGAYRDDADCRALVVLLLGGRISGTQVSFEPLELVVKGPANICSWTEVDDEVAKALCEATHAEKVCIEEGPTAWNDLMLRGHSAYFDTIF